MALSLQRLDFLADPAGLVLGVPDRAHDHLVAFVDLGPQGLAEPPAILRNHSARRPEDVRRRAVVLL